MVLLLLVAEIARHDSHADLILLQSVHVLRSSLFHAGRGVCRQQGHMLGNGCPYSLLCACHNVLVCSTLQKLFLLVFTFVLSLSVLSLTHCHSSVLHLSVSRVSFLTCFLVVLLQVLLPASSLSSASSYSSSFFLQHFRVSFFCSLWCASYCSPHLSCGFLTSRPSDSLAHSFYFVLTTPRSLVVALNLYINLIKVFSSKSTSIMGRFHLIGWGKQRFVFVACLPA